MKTVCNSVVKTQRLQACRRQAFRKRSKKMAGAHSTTRQCWTCAIALTMTTSEWYRFLGTELPPLKLRTWRGTCAGQRANSKKLGTRSTLNHVDFSIKLLLRDGSKALNKQRNYCSCLGISEAESKSLSLMHKDLEIPYSLGK